MGVETRSQNTEPVKIHWSKLRKGKFNVRLNAEMLTSLKHYRIITTHVEGTGYLDLKKTYEVEYDREYVLRKLITEVFKPLGIQRWDILLKVLQDAFELWEKENDS